MSGPDCENVVSFEKLKEAAENAAKVFSKFFDEVFRPLMAGVAEMAQTLKEAIQAIISGALKPTPKKPVFRFFRGRIKKRPRKRTICRFMRWFVMTAHPEPVEGAENEQKRPVERRKARPSINSPQGVENVGACLLMRFFAFFKFRENFDKKLL